MRLQTIYLVSCVTIGILWGNSGSVNAYSCSCWDHAANICLGFYGRSNFCRARNEGYSYPFKTCQDACNKYAPGSWALVDITSWNSCIDADCSQCIDADDDGDCFRTTTIDLTTGKNAWHQRSSEKKTKPPPTKKR